MKNEELRSDSGELKIKTEHRFVVGAKNNNVTITDK